MTLLLRRTLFVVVGIIEIFALVVLLERAAEAELASHYGYELAGNLKADGTPYNPEELGVAHKTLPFGTLVEIYNPATDMSVVVPVNDRGPYVGDRAWDMSLATARAIGADSGVVDVVVTIL